MHKRTGFKFLICELTLGAGTLLQGSREPASLFRALILIRLININEVGLSRRLRCQAGSVYVLNESSRLVKFRYCYRVNVFFTNYRTIEVTDSGVK